MPEEYEDEAEKQREDLVHDQILDLADLRDVLKTAQGRRVIRRILAKGGLFRISFTGNSRTFFNEGARNLSLWLYHEILETQPSRELVGDLMMGAERERRDDV